MKKLSAIVLAMCLMTACSGGDAAPGPSSGEPMSGESLSSQTSSGAVEEETPSVQPGPQVGKNYLYGAVEGPLLKGTDPPSLSGAALLHGSVSESVDGIRRRPDS